MESTHFLELGSSEYAVTQSASTLCRICAITHECFIQIYSDEGRLHGLAEKINKHLPISISDTDVLPKQICYQCTSTILAFNDLVDTCITAEKRLSYLISHQNKNTSLEEGKRLSSHQNFKESYGKIMLNTETSDETTSANGKRPIANLMPIQPISELEISTNESDESYAKLNMNGNRDGSIEEESEDNDKDESDNDPAHSKRKKKKKESISKCLICGKVFQFIEYLKVHLLSHSEDRPHQCHICGAAFKRKDHVNHHRKTVHMNHPDVLQDMEQRGLSHLSCELCGELCPTSHLMLQHKKKHLVNLNCEICKETFNISSALKEHMTQVHADVQLPCSLCGELLKSGRELFLHRQKHSASFICDVCGKGFSQQSTLRTHLVIHSDERPHVCDVCGKSFKLKTRLQLHKRSHADVRPYACTVCKDKRFKTKTALVVHNNMHNDVRRYPCPHCSFRARKNSDLVCHVRTHTGEKPYKCNICNRGFAQAGDMRKHRTTHERQKN